MTSHLLLVTLGPVQDFIAQARRTRDLWYGSHLLSELSRAAARTLAEQGATLIFPALDPSRPEDAAELKKCLSPLRPRGEPPLNVANKILATLPADRDPEAAARMVREAVLAFWRTEITGTVRDRCRPIIQPGVDDVWNEQVETFLEIAAAWVAFEEKGYKEARNTLEAAVAGRKNLRDFGQWLEARTGAPKSSLDGARDSILAEPVRILNKKASYQQRKAVWIRRRYRIGDGEQLDAIGLTKRAGGRPEQFVPIPNVALASWITKAQVIAPTELKAITMKCREWKMPRVTRGATSPLLGYDASVLLPNRVEPLLREIWPAEQDRARLRGETTNWNEQEDLRRLRKELGEPYPYVACLVADGDRMGKALDKLGTVKHHQTFSRLLSGFASGARKIVESRLGSLVYSGGDDVLAFLPVSTAADCAAALRADFNNVVEQMRAETLPIPTDQEAPTLSVGIGIGHLMESMGELLALGREAEKLAKGASLPAAAQRNALSIIVDKRSGGRRAWRAQWSEKPVDRLEADRELLVGRKLSARKIYQIAATLRRLPDPSKIPAESGGDWANLLGLEVKRSLARIDSGPAGTTPEDVGLGSLSGDYRKAHEAVAAWVSRLLIARTLTEAEPWDRKQHKAEAA